ncbi:MAG: binding domain of 6-phosphogluconate dehydrogenase [Gaiellales bacterium]|jgi:3-hydroxyisobutyrate dehydrogenase-like beta-hydroxyacid dehydrogenase|nr:binding domain of 6-phosphogluconate dehydrogenase [Gaiellales bacterium]
MPEPRVAFLGLGDMGGRMAARLAAGGLDVTVWNRSPERTVDEVTRERKGRTTVDGEQDYSALADIR